MTGSAREYARHGPSRSSSVSPNSASRSIRASAHAELLEDDERAHPEAQAMSTTTRRARRQAPGLPLLVSPQ
jgi:hypothetical protein